MNLERTGTELGSGDAAPPIMKVTVDKSTYLVRVHFKEDGEETMEQKIERLIRNDLKSGKYG